MNTYLEISLCIIYLHGLFSLVNSKSNTSPPHNLHLVQFVQFVHVCKLEESIQSLQYEEKDNR